MSYKTNRRTRNIFRTGRPDIPYSVIFRGRDTKALVNRLRDEYEDLVREEFPTKEVLDRLKVLADEIEFLTGSTELTGDY